MSGMSRSLTALVALDRGVDPESVRAALPGESEIRIVGIVDDLDDCWLTLQETSPDVLVIACNGYSERALVVIDAAVKQRSERPVIVLSQGSPNGFLNRVFEAGADDVVVLPELPERIGFALQKAVARKQGLAAATAVALAPLICVLGPKGGTGKTLTSANLAVGLASAGKRTALVDLDLQFGDLGLALGLSPDRTIFDLVQSGGSLDTDKINAYLATHSSGARVLIAPTRPDQAGAIKTEFLREVYATLRASNDYVIVDTPPGFAPEVIASIDSSTHICMVAMLDSLSLKNTKLGLETLDLMGYERERIKLVLNRADSRVGITSADVVSILGQAPDIYVPSDRDIPRSVNEGAPIILAKARSDAAQSFRTLTDYYAHLGMNGNGNGKPQSSRRLFSRKVKA
jgi:pilus assembly protein CpaE